MEYVTALIENWQEIVDQVLIAVGAFTALIGALYVIALRIPGEQPDKALKKALDLTVGWSKKKDD